VQKTRQPGEPVFSLLEFDNPYDQQSSQIILKLRPGEKGTVSRVTKIGFEINNFDTLEVPMGLKTNQFLKLSGDCLLQLFDQNWNVLDSLALGNTIPKLSEGKNNININANFNLEDGTKLTVELRIRGKPEFIQKRTSVEN